MTFEWDETKRLTNLRKHGIDFADVPLIFNGYIVTFEDDRFDYGEQRLITLEFITRKSSSRCPYRARRINPYYFCKKSN